MSNFNANQAKEQAIDSIAIREEFTKQQNENENKLKHSEVFQEILENLEPIDFREIGELTKEQKVTRKLQVVLTIKFVIEVANGLNCGLCRNHGSVYTYNGEYWQFTDRNELERFLGDASEKLGVHWRDAKYHQFRTELYKQFISSAYLPTPPNTTNTVLINLKNGTFEITKDGHQLRPFSRNDFLTYQLSFSFEPAATYPNWQQFLSEVLPESEKQRVLAEYLGYIFARDMKLEKTAILLGSGANGKSVVHDVTTALFGKENISHFGLESLGQDYYRAMIVNKLLNYSSEISHRLKSEKFKQLTSGEPIEARLPYGQPMTLTNYARLMFNSNELPRDVEHTDAFFRRFLIIPFDVTIPDDKQNRNLANEIIAEELAGVFNWILEGLNRLIKQGNFTKCTAVENALKEYRHESDSVAMFLNDEGYKQSNEESILLKDFYEFYKAFCQTDGYRPFSKRSFKKHLETLNMIVDKGNGNKVFVWVTIE